MRKRTKIEKADIEVARATGKARRSAPVRIVGALSELADQPPLIAFCFGLFATGLVLRDRRLASAGGRMLAAHLLATKLKTTIKHNVDRTRPHVHANGGRYAFRRGHTRDGPVSSFPSGHTAGAVAVARAYARDYPGHAAWAYGAAATVAAIQVPRRAHYPTDLVAGTLVGLLAERAIWRLDRALAGS